MSEQFEYINTVTGEKFLSDLSPEFINKKASEKDLDLEEYLARITLDARIKSFLIKIKSVVVKVGGRIIRFGRFVINFITDIAAIFENTIRGAVVGACLGLLLSQVPLIGWLLGPIAVTTFTFIGSLAGFSKDLINMVTSEDTREILSEKITSGLQNF